MKNKVKVILCLAMILTLFSVASFADSRAARDSVFFNGWSTDFGWKAINVKSTVSADFDEFGPDFSLSKIKVKFYNPASYDPYYYDLGDISYTVNVYIDGRLERQFSHSQYMSSNPDQEYLDSTAHYYHVRQHDVPFVFSDAYSVKIVVDYGYASNHFGAHNESITLRLK